MRQGDGTAKSFDPRRSGRKRGAQLKKMVPSVVLKATKDKADRQRVW
jgi:hypothetical protein